MRSGGGGKRQKKHTKKNTQKDKKRQKYKGEEKRKNSVRVVKTAPLHHGYATLNKYLLVLG